MCVFLISTNKINRRRDNMNEENCQAMLEHFSIRIYSLQKEFDDYKNDQMIPSDERKAAMFDRYHRIRALKLELPYLKLI